MQVSILIPCFNADRWIGRAIDSALAQTGPAMEVIVVDDGSTDSSLSVIESFGGRIRHESGPNVGGNRARNRLLELAQGDWLQYLDADDYLLPGKIARQAASVSGAGRDAPDVVFGPVTVEHGSGENSPRSELPIPEPHDPWVLLARWFLPQTGASLWRKSALLDVGGWKADQPCCQEHELYLRLLMAGKKFVYAPAGGAVYRHWSEDTVSRRKIALVHSERLKIELRAQEFLAVRGELTPARQGAINVACFETARSVWAYDRRLAVDIVRRIRSASPDFVPTATDAAPAGYQLAFRLVGFERAQKLADWFRSYRCQGAMHVGA
jgi:glycosyltransferase involved in cell wall biosynthesis